MTTILLDDAFDAWHELASTESSLDPGSYGACASFVGTMRDFNAGDRVDSMMLEHYPEMTQQFLDRICTEAVSRWELVECLIIHRYGEIKPGEPIVLTAAWSAHRAEAFDACRFLIEELKARAPFWKKESTESGERWVHDTLPEQ
ncbi:MAG: molybdenum cofactor biosynthesis protein MoaE [Gammaproteobacteria bacterium]|nr:molybdenum cofactor biosynthesis protein MoaE [Gammaproteobacteria bacterium]NNL06626.1 molybdenum cofactor biosynthesis protein MoaE [Gammaproteobacteria bacterium]